MTLFAALSIIARAHTRDDHQTGFVVEMGGPHKSMMPCSDADYIEAWRVIREQLNMPTNPSP